MKHYYFLDNNKLVQSPWALEVGDKYQGAKVRYILTQDQYDRAARFNDILMNSQNSDVKLVNKNIFNLALNDKLSEANMLLKKGLQDKMNLLDRFVTDLATA